jgi:hypothetical protein
VKAFTLGGVAAIIHLLVILRQPKPANRLILGANLYLLVGGIAAVAQQWWLLHVYGRLNETGIFLSMLIVGVVATIITPAGFVGVESADGKGIRRYSTLLLAATLIATGISVAFQGSRTWSSVVPLVALALLQRALAHRIDRPPT